MADAKASPVSELYTDDRGRPRHTHCRGQFCKVRNCRESLVAARDGGPVNLPDTFTEQRIRVAPFRDAVSTAAVRMWACPDGHSFGGQLSPSVDWDGDVARCLSPGCTRTSAEVLCAAVNPADPEQWCTLPVNHPPVAFAGVVAAHVDRAAGTRWAAAPAAAAPPTVAEAALERVRALVATAGPDGTVPTQAVLAAIEGRAS